MENVVKLSDHKKMPTFLFLQNNVATGKSDILFITINVAVLLDCVRNHMQIMCEGLKTNTLMSFSFETKLMNKIEIKEMLADVTAKQMAKVKSVPLQLTPPKKIQERTLSLVPNAPEETT